MKLSDLFKYNQGLNNLISSSISNTDNWSSNNILLYN